MSEPIKRGNKYRHVIQISGTRHSGTFDTKTAARLWAADLLRTSTPAGLKSSRKVSDIFERYMNEVSITKGGARWEAIRLIALSNMALGSVSIGKLDATHIAAWRDERLKTVQGGTVKREWNLISATFTMAINEWLWMTENPMKKVICPPASPPRDKLYNQGELDRLALSFGTEMETVMGRAGAAFAFALQTGMRAGEVVNLKPADLFLKERYVKVLGVMAGGKKTPAARRSVPLTSKAIAIIQNMPSGADTIFDLNSSQLDANFRRARDRAAVDGTFHDSRHYAATALSDKLTVMELARALGLKDLRILMSVYYEKKASDMALKLD
jgi:integrase